MSNRKRPMTVERAQNKYLHKRVIFRECATNLILTGECTKVQQLKGEGVSVIVDHVAGRGNNTYKLHVKDISLL